MAAGRVGLRRRADPDRPGAEALQAPSWLVEALAPSSPAR
ncbi:hypothetical protein H4W33_001244 [Kibdelosporangium phytohabitans]|nr:hypothetical protein [Kibdelosporangium phytohabitans]